MSYLFLVLGLVTLILGGDLLVRGAVSVALKVRISPLVVGMTVVSLGTSAPELLVSLSAVLNGHPDVAVGAVVGSNIANLGLVLGLTILIFPILINKDSIKIDWPMMFLATVLFYFFSQDNQLQRWEGLVFVSLLILFISWLIYRSRSSSGHYEEQNSDEVKDAPLSRPVWKDLSLIVIGAFGLYQGAEWLIQSVVDLAKEFDVSEKVISVTIVAFGTSVPELVTSIVAAFKKETDISVGNLIGSNIFNILAILGITSIVHPFEVSEDILAFDLYFMIAVTVILLPLMLIGKKLSYISGIILLSSYVFYIYFSTVSEF